MNVELGDVILSPAGLPAPAPPELILFPPISKLGYALDEYNVFAYAPAPPPPPQNNEPLPPYAPD